MLGYVFEHHWCLENEAGRLNAVFQDAVVYWSFLLSFLCLSVCENNVVHIEENNDSILNHTARFMWNPDRFLQNGRFFWSFKGVQESGYL